MNSVDRNVHYTTKIEQEAPHEMPYRESDTGWPTQGQVVLKDVVLRYRLELLVGLSVGVKAGEKIGM